MKFLPQAETGKRRQGAGSQRGFWAEYFYVAQTFDYGDYVILRDAPRVGVLRLVGLRPPLNDAPGRAFLEIRGRVYGRSHDLFQIIACENPSLADFEDIDDDDMGDFDGDVSGGSAYCEPLDSVDKKYFRSRSRRRFARRVGSGGVAVLVGVSAVAGIGVAGLIVAAFVGASSLGTAAVVGSGGVVLIGRGVSKNRSKTVTSSRPARRLDSGSRGRVGSGSRGRPNVRISGGGGSRPRVSSGSRSSVSRVSGGRAAARVSGGGSKARVGGGGSRLLGRGR